MQAKFSVFVHEFFPIKLRTTTGRRVDKTWHPFAPGLDGMRMNQRLRLALVVLRSKVKNVIVKVVRPPNCRRLSPTNIKAIPTRPIFVNRDGGNFDLFFRDRINSPGAKPGNALSSGVPLIFRDSLKQLG